MCVCVCVCVCVVIKIYFCPFYLRCLNMHSHH